MADSAGVRVVTYDQTPSAVATWRFDSVPTVVIGTAFGEEPYQLSRVRTAFQHQTGFLLGDGGSGELRLYDQSGRHIKSVGGIGSGPGEFQAGFNGAIQWLGKLAGDSLLAWDLALQRITIFDPELRFVRTAPLRLPVVAYVIAGAFTDGDLLVWPFGPRSELIPSPRVVVDTSYFAIVTQTDPANVDTIIRVPARPTYVEPGGASLRVPFTGEPSYAVGGIVSWAGSGQSGELRRYSKSGAVEVIVRLPVGGSIPASAVDDFRSAYLDGFTDSELTERTRVLNATPLPAELPAFDLLQVDPDGNTWIREYRLSEKERQRWLIINDVGEALASIEIPSALHVTYIGKDLIIGIWRNELDVEMVRVHQYSRDM